MLYLKYSFCFSLVLSVQFTSAQNLVANNGFESYTALPSGPGEWWKVMGWNNVNNVPVFSWPYASPDYLSTNGSGQAHLPNSIFGTVNPYSGNSVMGFVAYYFPGAADFREYISRQMTSPMTIGQTYSVSFMITNGTNSYSGSGCNHIGVCFSLTPLSQAQHEPINAIPQCDNTNVLWSTSWQLVSYTFTATAAYQYITIGNFYNDASTQHTVYNTSSSSTFGAYYFIDEIIVTPGTSLPVDLISFTGTNQNGINHLSWSTISELNNDYFSIERSTDGKYFSEIGKVNGYGNSSELLNYYFEDASPPEGINYYRLKQADYNGGSEYSQIIAVRNNKAGNPCIVYQDEQNGNFILKCHGIKNARVEIYTMEGKIIKVINIIDDADNLIDLYDRNRGMYILRITDGEIIQNFKLIRN